MPYANAVALSIADAKKAGTPVQGGLIAAAPIADGNKFLNDGRTVLRVKNGSASIITVTIHNGATLEGQAVADLTASVAATGAGGGGDFVDIGPFSPRWNQPDGYLWATFSAITTVTVGAARIP